MRCSGHAGIGLLITIALFGMLALDLRHYLVLRGCGVRFRRLARFLLNAVLKFKRLCGPGVPRGKRAFLGGVRPIGLPTMRGAPQGRRVFGGLRCAGIGMLRPC